MNATVPRAGYRRLLLLWQYHRRCSQIYQSL